MIYKISEIGALNNKYLPRIYSGDIRDYEKFFNQFLKDIAVEVYRIGDSYYQCSMVQPDNRLYESAYTFMGRIFIILDILLDFILEVIEAMEDAQNRAEFTPYYDLMHDVKGILRKLSSETNRVFDSDTTYLGADMNQVFDNAGDSIIRLI